MTEPELEQLSPEAAAYLRDLRELGVDEVVAKRERSDRASLIARARGIVKLDPRRRPE